MHPRNWVSLPRRGAPGVCSECCKDDGEAHARWLDDNYHHGICFRHRALWPWQDYLTVPQHAPPSHGWTAYCETGLVWEAGQRARRLGMFPWFGDAAYFDAPLSAGAGTA